MTRKETLTVNCGHEVEVTVVIGTDGTEECTIPYCCDECERLADEESQRYQDEGEARAHLHGAWA
jgi:hypothetical protein